MELIRWRRRAAGRLSIRTSQASPGSRSAVGAYDPANSRRNVVTVSTGVVDFAKPSTWTGAIDRSPCGTGTSAAMAVLHAKGPAGRRRRVPPRGDPRQRLHWLDRRGDGCRAYRAIVPTIAGSAWIMGFSSYVLDPTDPFPEGFTVGDIW